MIIFIFMGLVLQKEYGQEVDYGSSESEVEYGSLATERNYPYYFLNTAQDSILIPCRKLVKNLFIFIESNMPKDISGFKDKPFNLLTNKEKEQIIINAWHNKDLELFNTIHRIIISDTTEELRYYRKLSIMCLSVFNTVASKDILLRLLKNNDKEISIISALSLVQLGATDIGFEYIEKYYNTYPVKSQIVSALMIINTTSAIRLLIMMTEDKDPSYSLDASVALSLLGYCDLAFENIIKYKDSEIVFVRQMVAWCLAYYIGTPEAIKIIKNLKDDPYHFLKKDQEKIFEIYKI